MTVILFPPAYSLRGTSADEQSSAAFIPSSSDAALSCSAFGRVGACGDAAPVASLDPSSSGGTESRRAGFDGQVGEAVLLQHREGKTAATASAQAGKASSTAKSCSRSPGPTNGRADAYAVPSAGLAPGPLDPLCNAPTAVSIRLTKRVSRPAACVPVQENTRFILDVQKFNAALAEYGA